MTLSTGTRLGPYEILSPLGAGGMGEVYRARDGKLHRDVAIKVLPEAVAEDAERLARFQREAQVLASLNHPHIAAIYGLEKTGSVEALVLELVEGETLAERIGAGPLPVDEALAIARQIADALEAAHEKGIVHRDLKPANVKVTPDGKVKVLDFGLAKALSGDASSPDQTHSPTLTAAATSAGVVIGTAAYMSPEQARGRAVDKRADIWAFGAVLYEMLAGRKAFEGETVSDTLAAVLRADIDWDALPRETQPSVRRVLRRCLDRDPNRRLRDIGEARIEIDAIVSGAPEAVGDEATHPRRRAVAPAAVAAALAIAAAAAVAASWLAWRSPARPAAGPAPVIEFSIWAGDLRNLALSPDGRRLAYIDSQKLFLRDLADRVPREVAGDGEVRAAAWSPAGDELAVEIGERLWRVPIGGGQRRPICDLPKLTGVPRSTAIAGTWLRNDTLLFGAWRGGIYKVAATGGTPELLIPIDPKVEVDFHFVEALPDGESLLLAAHRLGGSSNPIGTMSIELYRKGRRTAIALDNRVGDMLPVGYSQGLLLTIQGAAGTDRPIWAFPFDAELGKVVGKPTILVPRAVDAVVGADGTLAYVAQRDSPGVVMRLDRKGAELGPLGKPQPRISRPALSPDGSRLALVIDSVELWVHDLGRDTMTRLVRDPQSIEDPQWSPDGRLLYYTVGNTFHFRRVRADPGAEPETVFEDAYRSFLAPDGRGALIFVGAFRQTEASGFYWVPFDEDGRPGKRRKLLAGFDSYGRLSPDGRAVAYGASETGRREAYVSNFPGMDQTIQLSSEGGGTPQWSTDGRSIFYVAGGALVAVDVGLDPAGRLRASPARKLFEFAPAHLLSDRGWTVNPDGSGFLFVKSLETQSRSEIVVRLNALSGPELKR